MRILSAAEQELGSKGFYGTSVGRIALRAGVSAGTFYLYFRSKEAVRRSVLGRVGDRMQRLLSESAVGARDYAEAERLRFDAYRQHMRRDRGLFRIVQEAVFLDGSAFREYQRKISDLDPTEGMHDVILREHFVAPRQAVA